MGPTRVSFRRPASLVATLFFAGVALAQSQESFYMKVSTSHGVIAGESKDPTHAGWIELRSLRLEAASGEGKGSESGMSDSHAASPEASKSPRDVASGQASGKRQHQPLRAENETRTSAQTNSAEVATESSNSAGSSASSRGGFGKRASEVVVTKITDKASPQLLKAETSGEHLPQIVIEICKGGAAKERLLLKDVVVSAYKTEPHASTETVTFRPARIERE